MLEHLSLEMRCSEWHCRELFVQSFDILGTPVDSEVLELFAEELNPVASKAQRKVPVPEGLDLTAWINEPPRDEEETKVGALWRSLAVVSLCA